MRKSLTTIEATMRLFQGFDVDLYGSKSNDKLDAQRKCFNSGLMMDLSDGNVPYDDIVTTAIKIHGINAETLNKTFHGSFDKVVNTDNKVLRFQQYLHYVSTYGAEAIMGFCDSNSVYFPKDDQNIPELIRGLKLKVIFAYTSKDIQKKLLGYVTSDIAISKAIMADVQLLLKEYYPELTAEDVDKFTNRELKIWAYKEFNIVPISADDFLRLAVYYATGKPTLIKSKTVLRSLKWFSNSCDGMIYMNKARVCLSVQKMAESFNRYKEYWMMLKNGDEAINRFINSISNASKKQHKPLPMNVLQNVMNNQVTVEQLRVEVQKARDIPLIKAWAYCKKEYERYHAIVDTDGKTPKNYRIRNGSVFTKNSMMTCTNPTERLGIIEDELRTRFPHLDGKHIKIPDNVRYPVYTSGKQTFGPIPYGTVIDIFNEMIPEGSDLVIAITWQNGNDRVDLDLKCLTKRGAFGWDASYKSESSNLIFSGDITDAPTPVTEAFLFSGDFFGDLVSVTVNNYTMYNNPFDVPFTLTLAWDNASNVLGINDGQRYRQGGRSYIIDPNKVITTINGVIANGQSEQEIGTVIQTEAGFSFIVGGFATDNKMTSIVSEVQNMRRQAVADDFRFEPRLGEFLSLFNTAIHRYPDATLFDIDLTLENISHDSFQTLLYPIVDETDQQQCDGQLYEQCTNSDLAVFTHGDNSLTLCPACATIMSASFTKMGMTLTKVV